MAGLTHRLYAHTWSLHQWGTPDVECTTAAIPIAQMDTCMRAPQIRSHHITSHRQFLRPRCNLRAVDTVSHTKLRELVLP